MQLICDGSLFADAVTLDVRDTIDCRRASCKSKIGDSYERLICEYP